MNIFCIKINLWILVFSTISWQCNSDVAQKKETRAEERTAEAKQKTTKKTILFFGNSLTAAYGLSPTQGFVSLIQHRLDSLELPYRCVNAGLSGETTAGGLGRIDWVLNQHIDIFVLELGGNDALRGINPDDSRQNLQKIITKVKEKYPAAKIILAGMEAPPNMGAAFTKKFRENYSQLAKENSVALIPFLLENVGGIRSLNQADGIHPNIEGNLIVTETVWKTLKNSL